MKYDCKIRVRYAETDMMGVVHHAVYPVWYEQARTEFTESLGMTYADMERDGIMTPISRVSSRFMGSCTYDDRLTVQVRVTRCTPGRVEFSYLIYKEGEEKPIHEGETVHAWTGPDLRPLNIKKKRPDIYQMVCDAIAPE